MSTLLTLGIGLGIDGAGITESLISWWELGEASGSRADSKGTNHLTDNNTVTQAAGKVGNAAQFTALNSEYLDIVDNADLSAGDVDFTICGWAQRTSGLSSDLIVKRKIDFTNMEYAIGTDVNTLKFVVDPTGDQASLNSVGTVAISNSTWFFFIAWHDAAANTINIQVNDGAVDSAAHTTGVFDGTANFAIGRNLYRGVFWDGLVDQVGFWKRVLTAAERTFLYNNGNGRAYSKLIDSEFSPSDISGLQLWLKADAITGLNDGDAVTTWNDSSGQGNDVTQATAGNKPTYQTNELNGKPIVRFDGTDDFLMDTSLDAEFQVNSYTFFVVGKQTNAGNDCFFSLGDSATADQALPLLLAGPIVRATSFASGGGLDSADSTTTPVGGFRVYSVRRSTADNNFTLWVNGTQEGQDAALANATADYGGASKALAVGARGDTPINFLDGDIAEIIFYDSALSTVNRDSVETYLGSKYNITVS